MIYRVTLPNGETMHTGYGPLADVWLNRHGGKLERIPLSNIPRPADEMWDGSALSAAIISVDRLRAILGDTNRRENALWNEIAAWRSAFVKRNGLAYDQDRDAIVHMDRSAQTYSRRAPASGWTSFRSTCAVRMA